MRCLLKNSIFRKMKLSSFLILSLILLLPLALSQLEFSEIMYEGIKTGAGHDWVEVYNSGNEPINLSNWKFREDGSNHGLILKNGSSILFSGDYATFTYNVDYFLFDNPTFNGNLFYTSIPSGLSGNGENLSLVDNNGFIVSSIYYNTSLGANGNGNTLCIINASWTECLPTPGEENVIYSVVNNTNSTNQTNSTKNLILSINNFGVIYALQEYNDFFKVSISPKNCSLKDKIYITYNFTGDGYYHSGYMEKEIGCSSTSGIGEYFFNYSGNYLLCAKAVSNFTESNYEDNALCTNISVIDISTVDCDLSLNLSLSHLNETNLYNKSESLKLFLDLNNESFPYQIEYWIEDLFGNIVKSKYITTNTNQKSWTIDIEEEDRVLVAKAKVYPACKDNNLDNNYAEQRFIVVNKNFWNEQTDTDDSSSKRNASEITISDYSPEQLSFGDLLKVDLTIYKGSTGKYSLSAWVEKNGKEISEKTKLNLKSKYTNYELTLPIQLDSNCDAKITDGKATLIIEGLDEHEEKSIDISGLNEALCKAAKSSSTSNTVSSLSTTATSSKFGYKISDIPASTSLDDSVIVKLLFNGDKSNHIIRLWSYLYRGSKCYSCGDGEREANEIELVLPIGEQKEVVLEMIPDSGIEVGEYSVKVKINKDNQKTDYELTDKILLVNSKTSSVVSTSASSTSELANADDSNVDVISAKKIHLNSSGYVVYESSNEKAKKLAPWILAVAFGLVCLVLIKKEAN